MALIKGAKRCFEWLRDKHAGDVVTRDEICEATNWSPGSLKDYFNKNKLAPFLLPLRGDAVKVLMEGSDLTPEYFDETFTQKAPHKVVLSVNDRLPTDTDAYVLQAPLGKGAVGHVWSARRKSSATVDLVAVKVMLPKEDLLAQSKLLNVRERFRRESINGAALNHSNVVKYIDRGEVQGNPFLVMELAEESVGQQLKRNGTLTAEEAAEIVLSVVHGLSYLHSMGMPHRDIKPDNILVFGDRVKVGDLGIVKWSDFDPVIVTAGTLTRASVQLGSWFYMAPEQQQNPHEAVEASDVYALGVSWIEMLTGSPPAPQAVGATAYPPPSTDEDVCNLIRRMVRYKPEERATLAEIEAVATKIIG